MNMDDEQVEAGPEIRAAIAAFAARYEFPLDAFQIEAMIHLASDRSVLVAAPTGTGKTIVAEFAIWMALQRGQRVIYTTPLKALSNQKYRDLRLIYGAEMVGLVTGDIVEHSRASVVVMTTEVYRNILLGEGGERRSSASVVASSEEQTSEQQSTSLSVSELAEVDFIVFDELHYLSDVGRGPVWEEAIICSPAHVQLVGLSATVSNAADLADWISRVHRPIELVFHDQRAVPLEHYYFLDQKLHLVQDASGKRIERFPSVGGESRFSRSNGFSRRDEGEAEEDWKDRRKKGRRDESAPQQSAAVADSAARAEKKPARPLNRRAPNSAEILTALREADMLPCLYFLPGRKVVEEAALVAARHTFTEPEEQELIRAEVGVWMENLPQEDRALQQVHSLLELLPRGLAFHHAGLLPGLKVLVETLFARGHLRAVFATDTLALGVNMPARAVVVGSLSKFDGVEMRLLTPNEYRQLTGRAGRRGMDVHGSAVIPYSPWEPFEQSFGRITGEMLPVTSSFVIRYNSVLNLWRPGDIRHLRRICASSLREYQRYMAWEQRSLRRVEVVEQRLERGRKVGKKKARAAEAAVQSLEQRRKQIGSYPLSRAGAAELDGTVFALRSLGYIGQDDQLTLRGRLLRNLFHPAGVLIVELLMLGVLDDLPPEELAEVCSWFTYDNDRRLSNRHILNARLSEARRELWRVEQHVLGVEQRAKIALSPGIVPDFHGIALSWSRGMSLTGLMRRIDLAEGDLLMVLNQSIDLIQQVQGAVGHVLDARDIWNRATPVLTDGFISADSDHATRRIEQLQAEREHLQQLRPLLAQAAASLMHGIIVQSRSVPSMVARVGAEELPLDAEEDTDPLDLVEDLK